MFRRIFLVSVQLIALVPWIVAFTFMRENVSQPAPEITLPTRVILPSLTATIAPTATPSATISPTLTITPSATPTPTASATLTATRTPTLTTRVAEINAIMPGVEVAPTATNFPHGTILLSAPPPPVEPLPDATHESPPFIGWYSFESDHPNVQYSQPWQARQHIFASQGQYHRSLTANSHVSFAFEGEGLRLRYVSARNMGTFDVIVDGEIIDTVDAYSSELGFVATRVYFVGAGRHLLTLRHNGRNPASEGYVIGLDAVQVFRGTANTLIIPPPDETTTPTAMPEPVQSVILLDAPPTIQATVTPPPPAELTVSAVIAYDENGNRAIDPAEGVAGISVRVVEAGTNRVIAQAFTDSAGYVEMAIVTDQASRVVVPYFGTVWDVPRGRAGGDAQFSLLLAPGNQPGLIP